MIPEGAIWAAIDATWPAARITALGPWTLREGQGGGKRVSAASSSGPVAPADIPLAEAAMDAMGQRRLFMVRSGQDDLDAALAARGYALIDRVEVLARPVRDLVQEAVPRMSVYTLERPLAIMEEIWAEGGVGPARLAVMRRAACGVHLFARHANRPAGVGFVAAEGPLAMVHAVEVRRALRRVGVAGLIMRQAAHWAAGAGAETMAVLCVEQNTAARALYRRLGFEPVCRYHYRIAEETQ